MATDYQEAIRILSEQEKILQFDKIGMDCYRFHSKSLSSVIPPSGAPAAPYKGSFPPPR